MKESKAQAAFRYRAKSINRRMEITMFTYPVELKKEPIFTVHMKRLISREDRKISEVNNVFTVETMIVLTDLMDGFLDEPTVKKAINPFSKFQKWNCDKIVFK